MSASRPQRILVWLPSPLGDAVLCTPALRALRDRFPDAHIACLAEPVVRAALSPTEYHDDWIDRKGTVLCVAKAVRRRGYDQVFLMKNSFGAALAVFLARIPRRIGYARDGRAWMLTDRIEPKRENGRFVPGSMLDYYLRLAEHAGAQPGDRMPHLAVDAACFAPMMAKLPALGRPNSPLVILVPGGAFGPSKCWAPERFAQTADRLIENLNATVVLSVAPHPAEQCIARRIAEAAKHSLVSLADTPLSMGELKAMFSEADLVIANDTGPRHIAIALGRKVITLFGPNDPAWTQTGYEDEIQIVGKAWCAPCQKPKCQRAEHLCMNDISVDTVCRAADDMLRGGRHD